MAIPPNRQVLSRKRAAPIESSVFYSSDEDDTVAQRPKKAKEDLWISPPSVKHGVQIVTVVVGLETDSDSSVSQQTFSIHRNLLVASSQYFVAALQGSFQESVSGIIKLTEDIPQVFQVFYNWLYQGVATEQKKDGPFETDHFWLLVFQMADRLLIDGLKLIAYERFRACFAPVNSRILPDQRKILPSQDLTTAVFESSIVIDLFRAWIVEHVLWYFYSSPGQMTGMELLVNNCPNLAAEVGKALIKGNNV